MRKRKHDWTKLAENFYRLEDNCTYWGRKKIGGHNHKKCFGSERKQAEAVFHEWVIALLKEQEIPVVATQSKNTLADYVIDYGVFLTKLVNDKIQPTTVENRLDALKALQRYWPGFSEIPVFDFDRGVMTDMRETLKKAVVEKTGKPISVNSVNGMCGQVRLYLKYLATERKLLAPDKCADLCDAIRLSKPIARKVEMPTPEQLALMRAYLARYKAGTKRKSIQVPYLFDVLLLFGIRIGTARQIKVGDFDFGRRELRVTLNKVRQGEDPERHLPIPPEAESLLREYIERAGLRPTDFLFTIQSINSQLKLAAAAAGLSNWFHHACRKYFGTKALEQGVDIPTTAELLCHQDGGVTLLKHYRQACKLHVRAAVQKLHLLPGVDTSRPDWTAVYRPQIAEAIDRVFASEADVAKPVLEFLLLIDQDLKAGQPDKALARLTSGSTGFANPDAGGLQRHLGNSALEERNTFAANLRFMLLSRGLAIKEMAAGANVEYTGIYALLKSQVSATPLQVQKLAAYFDIHRTYLTDPRNPRVDPEQIAKNFGFLAEKFGIRRFPKHQVFGRVISGRYLPTGDLLKEAAKVAGVSIHDLMAVDLSTIPGIGPQRQPATPEKSRFDRKTALTRLSANLNWQLMIKGMSASEISLRLGLPSYALQHARAHTHFPRKDTLEAVATFFGTTVDALCSPGPAIDPHQVRQNIVGLLTLKQLSPGAAATQMNMSPGKLADIVAGKALPTPGQLHKIAAFFGVQPVEILNRPGLVPEDAPVPLQTEPSPSTSWPSVTVSAPERSSNCPLPADERKEEEASAPTTDPSTQSLKPAGETLLGGRASHPCHTVCR